MLLSPEGTPLLADVGISKLEASSFTMLAGPIAESVWRSLRWLACEFLEFSDDDVNSTRRLEHNEKTDVWAFGMTIYVRLSASFYTSVTQSLLQELLTGDIPYAKIRSDLKSCLRSRTTCFHPNPPLWARPGRSVTTLHVVYIGQCWATDPTHRPSMGALLKEVDKYLKLI